MRAVAEEPAAALGVRGQQRPRLAEELPLRTFHGIKIQSALRILEVSPLVGSDCN